MIRQQLLDLDLPLFAFASPSFPTPTPHVSAGIASGRWRAVQAAMTYTHDPTWRFDVRTNRLSAGWSLDASAKHLTITQPSGADAAAALDNVPRVELGTPTNPLIPIDDVPTPFSLWKLPIAGSR
jgi:hypothetical protein